MNVSPLKHSRGFTLVALALLTLTAGPAWSAVLVSEQFTDALGNNTTADSLAGKGGGTGWSGNWVDGGGDGRYFTGSIPDSSNPSVAALQPDDAGNSAQIRTGGYYRQMASTYGTDGTTIWMSWRFRFTDGASAEDFAQVRFDRNATDIWAIGQARAFNGDNSSDGQYEVFGMSGSNTTNVNIGPRAPLANEFVVVKVTFGVANADAIDVWLNPTAATDFSSNSATRLTGTDFSFNRLQIYDANPVFYVDEFFLGQSLSDVTTIPSPAALPAGLALLGLAAMRRRRRL